MKKIISIFGFLLLMLGAWAVPARREPFQRVQPNGDTIMVVLIGDERWHAMFTVDGYLVCENKHGYLCYAKWAEHSAEDMKARRIAVPTRKKAKDANKRSCCEKRWLLRKKIDTL